MQKNSEIKGHSGSPAFMVKRSGGVDTFLPERCIGDAHTVPVRLEAALRISDCSSMLGPLIRFEGALVFSGLQASVVFRYVAGESILQEGRVVRPVPLLTPGQSMAIHGRPLRGIRGRSSIWIRLTDRAGHPLAEEQELGECVDGVREVHLPFHVGVGALVWVTARDWSARGPRCLVSGEVVLPRGVAMRLRFHPSENGRNGIGEAAAELQVIPPGMTWQAPERLIEGSPSDSSWVSVQFAEPGGCLLGREHAVGRCMIGSA